MKPVRCLLVFLLLGFRLASARCPEPSELVGENDERVCARLFEDSDLLYENCCAGGYVDLGTPSDVPEMGPFWDNKASSLVVGRRCELMVWERSGKRGNKRTFRTGIQHRLVEAMNGLFGDWDNTISSYYCVCT